MNNFYNEPSTIKELNRMETKIPKPAIKKCISATLIVLLGNAYGKSVDAIEPTEDILQKPFQSDRISIISSNVYLTMKKFFKKFFREMRVQNVGVTSSKSLILNPLNTKNSKIQEFIKFSANLDKNNAKSCANSFYVYIINQLCNWPCFQQVIRFT